jgi:hypothetical protein
MFGDDKDRSLLCMYHFRCAEVADHLTMMMMMMMMMMIMQGQLVDRRSSCLVKGYVIIIDDLSYRGCLLSLHHF